MSAGATHLLGYHVGPRQAHDGGVPLLSLQGQTRGLVLGVEFPEAVVDRLDQVRRQGGRHLYHRHDPAGGVVAGPDRRGRVVKEEPQALPHRVKIRLGLAEPFAQFFDFSLGIGERLLKLLDLVLGSGERVLELLVLVLKLLLLAPGFGEGVLEVLVLS